MPAAMKLPPLSASPRLPKAAQGPSSELGIEPSVPSGQVFSYTYGRLRPRFITRGAWHELACLLEGNPPEPGTGAFDRALLKLFLPPKPGELPSTFYLARELVWPVEDVLGVPQCVVAPASDEEIVELLENLPTSSSPCALSPASVVRGVLQGFATGLGAGLDGLPRVAFLSAFPFQLKPSGSSRCGPDYGALFQAYQPLLANNGIGDELRAINLVLTTSAAFYELASRLDRDAKPEQRLVAMHALPVLGPRSERQLEVVFSFQSPTGAVARWFQRVTLSGPFPYLTSETEKQALQFYGRPAGTVAPAS